MTERAVADDFWDDPFIEELPAHGKFLYLWCMTNKHLNPSGIFEISPKKIAGETGLNIDEVKTLFANELKTKMRWNPETCTLWVFNFTRRQCKSSKFLWGAVAHLRTLKDSGLFQDYLKYNDKLFELYHIDTVSLQYPYSRNTPDTDTYTDTDTDTLSDKKGVRGGSKGGRRGKPKTRASVEDQVQEGRKLLKGGKV